MKKFSTKKFVSLAMSAMLVTGIFSGCGPTEQDTGSGGGETQKLTLSVANANLEKAANASVTLATDLGVTVSEGATLSYQVVKKQGAGSAVEALTVTDSFTVEAGYFYDILVTATKGEETATQFVQVRDESLDVFSFEAASEEIPIIGTGVVQWHKMTDANGNSMMKMYRPHIAAADNGNVWMKLDKLFDTAGIEYEETEKVYDIYADIAYDKALDEDQSWGVQLKRDYSDNSDDEYLTKASGRYFVGQAAWEPSDYCMYVQFWARTKKDCAYAIDGTNNFLKWDNIVMVEGEKKVVEETPPEEIEKPEAFETFAVTNVIHDKAAGDVFTMNAETLGYTAAAGVTVTYEVTKVLGAGTEKEVITCVGNQFTVEQGYFYDITVTATAGDQVKYGYAQVRDQAINLFDFNADNETLPTIGTGVTQWSKMEVNGNKMMKMIRPVHISGNQAGGANVVVGGAVCKGNGLLDAGSLSATQDDRYDVYADITYYILTDGNTQWAVQLTDAKPGAGWVTKKTGRYYLGVAKMSKDGTTLSVPYTVRTLVDSEGNATPFAIDGENNYTMWDNVVLVKK